MFEVLWRAHPEVGRALSPASYWDSTNGIHTCTRHRLSSVLPHVWEQWQEWSKCSSVNDPVISWSSFRVSEPMTESGGGTKEGRWAVAVCRVPEVWAQLGQCQLSAGSLGSGWETCLPTGRTSHPGDVQPPCPESMSFPASHLQCARVLCWYPSVFYSPLCWCVIDGGALLI